MDVVQCYECVYYVNGECALYGIEVPPDGYCHNGVKDDEEYEDLTSFIAVPIYKEQEVAYACA